jgi:sucrose phosphorylase
MKLQNKAMLITYPDSLGHNLKDLSQVMDRYFSKAIGGIHLLPFFPSHGDRGFSPMTYEKVAPEFGTWSDVEKLGEQYYLIKKRAQTRVFRHESSTQKRPIGAFF